MPTLKEVVKIIGGDVKIIEEGNYINISNKDGGFLLTKCFFTEKELRSINNINLRRTK